MKWAILMHSSFFGRSITPVEESGGKELSKALINQHLIYSITETPLFKALTHDTMLNHTVPRCLLALLESPAQMKRSKTYLWHVLSLQHSLLADTVWRNIAVSWHRDTLDLQTGHSIIWKELPSWKDQKYKPSMGTKNSSAEWTSSPKQTGKLVTRFLQGSSVLLIRPPPTLTPAGEKVPNLRCSQESATALPHPTPPPCLVFSTREHLTSLGQNGIWRTSCVTGKITSCLWAYFISSK